MNVRLTDLLTESTVASTMVAALAFVGEANGTVAVAIIGAIHIIDLPGILQIMCEQARAGCEIESTHNCDTPNRD